MRANSLSSPLPSRADSPSSSTDFVAPSSLRNTTRRPHQQTRPPTSSGIPDQKLPPSLVQSFNLKSFVDFIPTRRSTKKSHSSRKDGVVLTQPSRSWATLMDPVQKDAQVSAPDRSILEKRKLGGAARESQFKMKGNKKHHAYPAYEAPYPRNYERPVMDHDVWETGYIRQLCGSLTFHVFETPPTKVLDLGCGSGYWILECAKLWRNCEFVGLDLVPLHPDLSHLPFSDLGSRITWVQANCLEGLPFPCEEFDFVHIKRLAHGIPEHKWDFLLEEISRVMKPGAAIEMIEEDLYFPGRSPESPQISLSSTSNRYLTTRSTSAHSLPNGQCHNEYDQRNFSQLEFTTTISPATISPTIYPHTPSTIGTKSMMTLPTSIHSTDAIDLSGNSDHLHSESLRPSRAPLNPRDHSLLEYIYTEMHAARFINLSPLPLLAHSLPVYFNSVRSHTPIMFTFPPHDLTGAKQTLLRSTDDGGASGGISGTAQQCHKDPGKAPSTTLISRCTKSQKESSSSLHLLSMASNASNPTQNILPSDSSHVSPKTSLFPGVYPESMGPTTYSHAVGEDIDAASCLNTLPNQRLKFDLQCVNLHLSTRVTEILACAEAMWEWLCEFQDSQRPHRGPQPHMHRERSLLRRVHPRNTIGTRAHEFINELIGLSRPEFDALLTRFELDMRDCINIEARITSTFHAPAPVLSLTDERKASDNACENREYHVEQREKYKTTEFPAKGGINPSAAAFEDGEADSTGQRLSRNIRAFCAWKSQQQQSRASFWENVTLTITVG